MRARWIIASSITLMLTVSAAFGDEFVHGYTRRDGTYVQPHMRSSPDGDPFNNYSTRGNVNPYTGQPGTHDPYHSTFGGSSGTPGGSPSGTGLVYGPYWTR